MHNDWEHRLVYEYADLKIKILDLADFLKTGPFKLDNIKRDLLKRQLELMKEYAAILEQRLNTL